MSTFYKAIENRPTGIPESLYVFRYVTSTKEVYVSTPNPDTGVLEWVRIVGAVGRQGFGGQNHRGPGRGRLEEKTFTCNILRFFCLEKNSRSFEHVEQHPAGSEVYTYNPDRGFGGFLRDLESTAFESAEFSFLIDPNNPLSHNWIFSMYTHSSAIMETITSMRLGYQTLVSETGVGGSIVVPVDGSNKTFNVFPGIHRLRISGTQIFTVNNLRNRSSQAGLFIDVVPLIDFTTLKDGVVDGPNGTLNNLSAFNFNRDLCFSVTLLETISGNSVPIRYTTIAAGLDIQFRRRGLLPPTDAEGKIAVAGIPPAVEGSNRPFYSITNEGQQAEQVEDFRGHIYVDAYKIIFKMFQLKDLTADPTEVGNPKAGVFGIVYYGGTFHLRTPAGQDVPIINNRVYNRLPTGADLDALVPGQVIDVLGTDYRVSVDAANNLRYTPGTNYVSGRGFTLYGIYCKRAFPISGSAVLQNIIPTTI